MFVLDPVRGRRRRALIRDKAAWALRKTRETAGATQRDLGNRLMGLQSRTRALLSREAVDDATIVHRVRTALGRVTPHHRAISVMSDEGWVTLTGDALLLEIARIGSTVRRVRGVDGVSNDMRVHLSADGIPALQGTPETARLRNPRKSWTTTAATVAGVGLIGMAAASLGRRSMQRE